MDSLLAMMLQQGLTGLPKSADLGLFQSSQSQGSELKAGGSLAGSSDMGSARSTSLDLSHGASPVTPPTLTAPLPSLRLGSLGQPEPGQVGPDGPSGPSSLLSSFSTLASALKHEALGPDAPGSQSSARLDASALLSSSLLASALSNLTSPLSAAHTPHSSALAVPSPHQPQQGLAGASTSASPAPPAGGPAMQPLFAAGLLGLQPFMQQALNEVATAAFLAGQASVGAGVGAMAASMGNPLSRQNTGGYLHTSSTSSADEDGGHDEAGTRRQRPPCLGVSKHAGTQKKCKKGPNDKPRKARDPATISKVQQQAASIMQMLGPGRLYERQIREALGNNPDTSKALRLLMTQGKIERLGAGGRGDPFSYMATPLGLSGVEGTAGLGMEMTGPGAHAEVGGMGGMPSGSGQMQLSRTDAAAAQAHAAAAALVSMPLQIPAVPQLFMGK